MDVVNLREKLAAVTTYWDPKVIAELNGQHVRLARFAGDFVWHRHDEQDELFLVLEGVLRLQLRDRTLRLEAGELVVVPRGVEHCPCAEGEVAVLLFEPAATRNTGDVGGERTVEPTRI